MAWYRAGGGGIPSSLKTDMNAVLNKKFGTTGQNYPPAGWPDDVNLLGPLPVKTASGAVAAFSDGADDVPIKSASFGIVASGGNGTPSSPVPIVGRSSVTVYHTDGQTPPVESEQVTIQLGQTVYGGTLALASDGTLTLTLTSIKLNLWELPCTRLETSVSGKYRFALTTQDLSAPSTSVATTGICNVAQSISADYLYGAHDGIAVRNSTTIHMYDENYSSDTALNFKAHLEEIGAVAVLPLRTSAYTVITGLDEISINTYLGDNSIWADTGDTEVTYRADIQLALNA